MIVTSLVQIGATLFANVNVFKDSYLTPFLQQLDEQQFKASKY